MLRQLTIKIALLLNIGVVLCSILIVLAINISPVHCWPLLFMGFSYPFVLLAHSLFVILWLSVRRKRLALISLFCLAGSLFYTGFFYQWHSTKPAKGYTIVSYNVQRFNYDQSSLYAASRKSIMQEITKQQPDIVCLQEYYNDSNKYYCTTDTLAAVLKMSYNHCQKLLFADGFRTFGQMTFSKYPIVTRHKDLLPQPAPLNNIIYTDIKINNDTIRVFNAHLESIRLVDTNYRTIEGIRHHDYSFREYLGSKEIMKKCKKAASIRAMQAECLAKAIHQSPYPLLVCGDFNDIALSYAYHVVKTHNHLIDAFNNSGNGFGGTYIGELPSFRIDYILSSRNIKTWNYTTGTTSTSDHYPIACMFQIVK